MPGTSHVRSAAPVRIRRWALRPLLVGLLLAPLTLLAVPANADVFGGGSGGGGPLSSTHKVHKSSKVTRALRIAEAQTGDPYVYGAAGPGAFDCSGLVYYATHHAGLSGVPRTSSAQSQFMRHISRSQMRPGDFVFFYGSGGVYHVGIYVGRVHGARTILHAPYPGSTVHREVIWTDSWFAGTLRGR